MQAQIDQAQARFKQAADASNARARRLYVQGPAESVAMLFSADSIVELTRLQFLMEKSSEQDSKIIVDTSRLRSELGQAERAQQDQRQPIGAEGLA